MWELEATVDGIVCNTPDIRSGLKFVDKWGDEGIMIRIIRVASIRIPSDMSQRDDVWLFVGVLGTLPHPAPSKETLVRCSSQDLLL